ncbi:lysozyme [Actinosynnema sp.]|uniref:lysozyme n=1 Tax=Actinosynnema sp. TaxID=1872144 RepID=UPI003F867690
MTPEGRTRRWATRWGLPATAAAVLLAVARTTALHAEPLPDEGAPEGSDQHYAGSEIAKREGWASARSAAAPDQTGTVPGMDVSSHQGDVDWGRPWGDGARFAYVKATEGTGYTNPHFQQQYDGSRGVGMVRGAYHFALPDRSDGGTQADYFVDHGGGWAGDGMTLPGALDVEYNPYGDTCYGKDQDAMAEWVRQFSGRLAERTGRHATIYTSTSWWNQCVGDKLRLGESNPLWVAHYTDQLGQLPHGWDYQTFWQWQAAGQFPGDQNLFNGDAGQLTRLATG